MTERPRAAVTTRWALDASMVCNWTWFITKVSMSCASGKGASTSRDWFVREDWGAFTHGVDIASEPEVGKPCEESVGEYFERVEVGEVLLGETE